MPKPSLLKQHHREVVTIFAAALALTASAMAGSSIGWIDGFLYDLSLAIHPIRPGTSGEPVALIAVDQGSLDSEDLAATPRAFFGPLWAKLINGLAESGVEAIGFDIIFTYSADLFKEDYDLTFHQALARFHDRLVLTRSAYSQPAPPIAASVYDLERDAGKDEPSAIAYVELTPDGDGVQRQVTASLHAGDDRLLPTLAAALIARGKGAGDAGVGAARSSRPARSDPDLPFDRCPALSQSRPVRRARSLWGEGRADRHQSRRGG